MATTRKATAVWEGPLLQGAGRVTLESSGLGTYEVTWPSRAEAPDGRTSPEELIAAAHAACFSMALCNTLSQAGGEPVSLATSAEVGFQPGEGITGVALAVRGVVRGLDADGFRAAAEKAKENCPVSRALTGTTITLDADLA